LVTELLFAPLVVLFFFKPKEESNKLISQSEL
jgi:hypothetical protein